MQSGHRSLPFSISWSIAIHLDQPPDPTVNTRSGAVNTILGAPTGEQVGLAWGSGRGRHAPGWMQARSGDARLSDAKEVPCQFDDKGLRFCIPRLDEYEAFVIQHASYKDRTVRRWHTSVSVAHY